MHIAGASPVPMYVSDDQIDPAMVEKEREIRVEAAKNPKTNPGDKPKQPVPDAMIPKVVDGQIAKWKKEICLLDQVWVRDPEGKKTIGLEIAEQLDWRMPDVLLYPTGGGTGLVGIPKGYEELRAMGWLSGPLPRLFAVQAEGCAPVVKAFAEGAETTTAWENPTTLRGRLEFAVTVRVVRCFASCAILGAARWRSARRRSRTPSVSWRAPRVSGPPRSRPRSSPRSASSKTAARPPARPRSC
jgi:hypothetical protein